MQAMSQRLHSVPGMTAREVDERSAWLGRLSGWTNPQALHCWFIYAPSITFTATRLSGPCTRWRFGTGGRADRVRL